MKKRYEINPNTIKSLNEVYIKKNIKPENERFNEWMIPYLLKYLPQSGKVFDVGCCMGKTLAWIHEQNDKLELIGSEISDYCIDVARKYYPYINFICEDSEFSEHNDIDIVICSQTLEHVDRPKEVIYNMMMWLKVGGTLFITVPYPNSNLDRGVKLHQWTFYEEDFKELLPNCECIKADKDHLIVIWKK